MKANSTLPSTTPRPDRRTFSNTLKKKLVRDLEKKLTTIASICRRYEVSRSAVYKWIDKFSLQPPGIKTVVEMDSEEYKTIQLQNQVDELLRLIGQQQVTIDLNVKILEHVSTQVGYDVKKKYAPLFSKSCEITPKPDTL